MGEGPSHSHRKLLTFDVVNNARQKRDELMFFEPFP